MEFGEPLRLAVLRGQSGQSLRNTQSARLREGESEMASTAELVTHPVFSGTQDAEGGEPPSADVFAQDRRERYSVRRPRERVECIRAGLTPRRMQIKAL